MSSPIERGRYKDAQEILDRIEEERRKVDKMRRDAFHLNLDAQGLLHKMNYKTDASKEKGHAVAARKRKRAERMYERIDAIESRTIPYLKAKLACIQTKILPGVQIDTSIQK